MVAFHDRRKVVVTPSDLPRDPGVSLSRRMIHDSFYVTSAPTGEAREYSVHEVLPNGEHLERSTGHRTRYAAHKSAGQMSPTAVREL